MQLAGSVRTREGPLSPSCRAVLTGPGGRVSSLSAGPAHEGARRASPLFSPLRTSRAEASVERGVLPPGRCSLV
ncbi:hypothetical protein NDU88_001717 [Pleurodeles waltl]|uniref:Uncharacterized protein n=1 Tax=Pleurodeles waltl TaxID=8319 RepID=A0AAV7RDM3_PLEWA|nr:hypothetical protein NDU88_001717 [Pleurodeles waltl]